MPLLNPRDPGLAATAARAHAHRRPGGRVRGGQPSTAYLAQPDVDVEQRAREAQLEHADLEATSESLLPGYA
jgi:hypothetical protein